MVKKNGMPNKGEIILCTVNRITPYAAWCTLDEYDVEGMIHISEVVGKWIHDIKEFVKPNKQYVAKVLKIDEKGNVVSLSLKRVSKFDKKQKMDEFRKVQRADKILEQTGKELGKTLQQAHEEVGFLLKQNFGDLFTAFEEIKNSHEVLDKLEISKQWSQALIKVVEKSFKDKETVLKVDIEIKSYAEDGVDSIKKILSTLEGSDAEIKYISAPRYRLEMKTKDPKNAEKSLREKLDSIVKNSKDAQVESTYRFVR